MPPENQQLSYTGQATSIKTSAGRSGMSTMTSWPHGISKVREVRSAFQTPRYLSNVACGHDAANEPRRQRT